MAAASAVGWRRGRQFVRTLALLPLLLALAATGKNTAEAAAATAAATKTAAATASAAPRRVSLDVEHRTVSAPANGPTGESVVLDLVRSRRQRLAEQIVRANRHWAVAVETARTSSGDDGSDPFLQAQALSAAATDAVNDTERAADAAAAEALGPLRDALSAVRPFASAANTDGTSSSDKASRRHRRRHRVETAGVSPTTTFLVRSAFATARRHRGGNNKNSTSDGSVLGGVTGWELYSSASVALANLDNMIYTGTIGIGTPPQRFRVVVDTGSADLWVFSAQTHRARQSFLQYYDHAQSATYTPDNTAWAIEYGRGGAWGFLSRDIVGIGGAFNDGVRAGPSNGTANSSSAAVPVPTPTDVDDGYEYTAQAVGQIFAEATQYSAEFGSNEQQPVDGILGFAFTSVARSQAATLLDTLYDQAQIDRKACSFVFSKQPADAGSRLLLGSPDSSYAPKGFTYLDAFVSVGQWMVKLDAIALDEATITGMCTSESPCVALVDTGTSLVGIPARQWTRVFSAITTNRPDCRLQGKVVQCTYASRDKLPNLAFRLRGVDFILTPADYMTGNTLGLEQLSPPAVPNNVDMFILGAVFLRTVYTVFDMDANRIGFANASDQPALTWWFVVTTVAGTLALMALGMGLVRCKHRRRALRRAARAALHAGGSSVAGGGAPASGGGAGGRDGSAGAALLPNAAGGSVDGAAAAGGDGSGQRLRGSEGSGGGRGSGGELLPGGQGSSGQHGSSGNGGSGGGGGSNGASALAGVLRGRGSDLSGGGGGGGSANDRDRNAGSVGSGLGRGSVGGNSVGSAGDPLIDVSQSVGRGSPGAGAVSYVGVGRASRSANHSVGSNSAGRALTLGIASALSASHGSSGNGSATPSPTHLPRAVVVREPILSLRLQPPPAPMSQHAALAAGTAAALGRSESSNSMSSAGSADATHTPGSASSSAGPATPAVPPVAATVLAHPDATAPAGIVIHIEQPSGVGAGAAAAMDAPLLAPLTNSATSASAAAGAASDSAFNIPPPPS